MKIKEAFKVTEYSNLLFMSDLHYNHENIIKFNNRPFSGVKEMNEYIEEELALKVGGTDILFDLGDLFWRTSETKMKEVLKLAGPKEFHKIMGNHDKEKVYTKSFIGSMFTTITDILEIKVEWEGTVYPMTLCHYPMVSWNHKPRGSFMLFGHCHGNIDSYMADRYDLAVDLGLDGTLAREYGSFIIPFSVIFDYMTRKAGGSRNFAAYVSEKCKEL